MTARFGGLTKAQDEALTAIALGGSGLRAHRKTIEALLKRGLIYRRGEEEVGRDRFGVITVPVYEMPLREHMRWCQWCADNFPDATDPLSGVPVLAVDKAERSGAAFSVDPISSCTASTSSGSRLSARPAAQQAEP